MSWPSVATLIRLTIRAPLAGKVNRTATAAPFLCLLARARASVMGLRRAWRRPRAVRPAAFACAVLTFLSWGSHSGQAVPITQTVTGIIQVADAVAEGWADSNGLVGQRYWLTYSYDTPDQWAPVSDHARQYISPGTGGTISLALTLNGNTRVARDGAARMLQIANDGYATMAVGDSGADSLGVEISYHYFDPDGVFMLAPFLMPGGLPGEIWVHIGTTLHFYAGIDAVTNGSAAVDLPEPQTGPLFVAGAICLLIARLGQGRAGRTRASRGRMASVTAGSMTFQTYP